MTVQPLLLIDIGNSAAKLGFFSGYSESFLSLPRKLSDWNGPLTHWFKSLCCSSFSWADCAVHVSSVCPELWERLHPMLVGFRSIRCWECQDIPIQTQVDNKNSVGSDRLFSALYALSIKPKKRPAIISNVGTAQTIDVLSPQGVFLGGQIVPGISTGLLSLNTRTAFLPRIDRLSEDIISTPFGKSTPQAMEFGAVNSACGIIERTYRQVKKAFNCKPCVYVSAGAGKIVCRNLQIQSRFIDYMTLYGLLIAVE